MRLTLISFLLLMSALACGLADSDAAPPTQAPAPSQTTPPTSPPSPPALTTEPASIAPTEEPSSPATVTGLPNPGTAQWVPVAQGLTHPVDLQAAGDERLFVVQQPGAIRIIADGEVRDNPFLDIRDRVLDDAFERGLLGLAFDPDYDENGMFYVNYTGSGGHTRISRFKVTGDPNLADPASEQVLLTIDQPFANHNGGGLTFGPDGYLYIGVGDGGSGGDPRGNAQDLTTILGTLLRIDVHGGDPYAVPPDNPFLGSEGARPEIWDYGLRNPWRFAFDPANGDLYIADVGQNQWEEINFESAGSGGGVNYGWNLLEGSHPYEGGGDGTTLPVAEYDHGLGCSVTGGVVVRDPQLPGWEGVYLYGDFCSGNLWGLVRDAGGGWISERLYGTDFRISAFGTDNMGRVHLLDHNGGIYRLAPTN